MLVDRIVDRKRFNEDEPQLRLLSQLFCRCISLPLVDAEVLVNYGSDNYGGDKQLLHR